jgi:hypothetical protein
MKLKHHHLWAGLVLICLHGLVAAQVSAARAEALMRKSGVWAQLADVAVQVKSGMSEATVGERLTPDAIERLDQLVDDAFAPEQLRQTFLQVLAQRVTPAQGADALKWYDSPAGRLIAGLEEASSADFDDLNQVMAEGNQAFAKASLKRQALLAQTVQATRAAEGMVTLQINSTVAVMQGIANVIPMETTPPAAELRKLLEAQRPQMLASTTGVLLSMFALTYQTASDKALQQYVKFLSSRSGVALSLAMMEALDQSLSNAARLLGSAIPQVPGTTRL